ncbi:AraC family transcriptional regulator [Rhodanobacter sp. BL-MT-08]
MSRQRNSVQRQMIALLDRLTPVEGYNLTPLDDVRLLRSNRRMSRTPVLYDPGVVIVVQGRKRGYLGDTVYLYDAQHYLVVSVPVPFTMETDATPAEPMLAIYLRLDFQMAADLLLELDEHHDAPQTRPRSMMSTPIDDALADSVLRLLQVLGSPLDTTILGPALLREIYFRIFVGQQGGTLRTALAMQGPFGKVAKAIRKIHRSYTKRLAVEDLAKEASMSVPSFHAHFRTVTNTSPMQYLKSTRLHQARLLMMRNGLTAAAACAQVGYESSSQFSREFKRLFGRTPVDEVERMKRRFALPPALPSAYVSSH